jgi:hypothetical protein
MEPTSASVQVARFAGGRRIGVALVFAASALLLLGLVGPWIIFTPENAAAATLIGASGSVRGPRMFFSTPSLALIFSGGLCFPAVPAIAALALILTGIGTMTRGRAPLPLDLVVATCAVGFVFVAPILLILGIVGFSRERLVYAVTLAWGLYVTLAGYLAAFVGCFLLRRRRVRVA